MSSASRLTTVALALALGGCGGDGTEAPAPDVASDVANDLSETDVETDDAADGDEDAADSVEDAAVVDDVATTVCEGIICNTPPASECSADRAAVWSYGADGTCEVDAEGQAICRYPVSDTRRLDGEACRIEALGPACSVPHNTCEVAFSRVATWISAVRLPAGEDDVCCFDFNGDDIPDNGLAELAQAIAPLFEADPQTFIDAFVQRGLNAYLMQFQGLDSFDDDSSVSLDILLGLDPDGVYADNLLGTERFMVRGASYDGAHPRAMLNGAIINGGRLKVTGRDVTFLVPFAAEPFDLVLSELRIDGAVSLGDNGRGPNLAAVDDGSPGARFCGLVPIAELYRGVNAFAASTCGCLDVGGQPLVVQREGQWQCNDADATLCNSDDPEESVCADLAQYCGAALLLVTPDVGDSVSLGLWVQGVSAGLADFVDGDGAPLVCE